jgi:hypothetical protein
MVDVTDIFDGIMDKIITSSNMGLFSSAVFIGSLYGNYYLFNKMNEFKDSQEEYVKLFIILEPILTKIISKEVITEAEIDDIKRIRGIIKFKFVK